MKTLKYFTVLTVAAIFLTGAVCAEVSDGLPEGAAAESAETIITPDGRTFQFVRFTDSEGNPGSVWLDSSGNPVSESGLPPAEERSSIDSRLSYILGREPSDPDYIKDDGVLDVVVALKVKDVVYNDPPEKVSMTIDESGAATVMINGKRVGKEEIDANIKKISDRIAERREVSLKNRRNMLRKLAARNGFYDVPGFQEALDNGRASVKKVPMKKGEITAFAKKNSDIVAGVELYAEPQDELDDAVVATNIDPWALDYPNNTGSGIGIYMSESGCCDPGHITNYTRLAGTATDHSENVSAILRGVSPDSYVYCRSGYTLPPASDLNGHNGNPAIYIENHSYYTGTGTDYTEDDRDFDNHIYADGIAVFNAAGNLGGGTGNVTSPGKGLNVITVGNYNDSNDTIWSSSSFVNPQTKNEKPEIAAPGTNITAGGHTLTGTSMASPHAAAFAADFLSVYTWMKLRPHMVKAFMLAGATDNISGGYDKVGLGGTDYLSCAWNVKASKVWEGTNSAYSNFDSADPYPDNGFIDYKVHFSCGSPGWEDIRIVLSWLNRGTYIYDHRADPHPLGMDFDMTLLDPNGNLIESSVSYDNSFEVIEFTPATEGYYTIRIHRYSNRDTDSKISMALAVNAY